MMLLRFRRLLACRLAMNPALCHSGSKLRIVSVPAIMLPCTMVLTLLMVDSAYISPATGSTKCPSGGLGAIFQEQLYWSRTPGIMVPLLMTAQRSDFI